MLTTKTNLNNLFEKLANLHRKEILSIIVNKKEIPTLANIIGEFINAGDWLFLDGDLGAGKTALAKEISFYFGLKNGLTSPTFAIIHSEILPIPIREISKILHLDLYRLKSGNELCFIGLEEEFSQKNTVAIIEWPHILDEDDWENFFEKTGCKKPKKILNIRIHENNDKRIYEIYY